MRKSELAQRVAWRLAELNIGPVEAAGRVPGLEKNFLRDLLEGRKRSFRQETAPLVAQALDWTVPELLGRPAEDPAFPVKRVPLLDKVTAGKLQSPSSQIPVEDVPLLAFADLGRGEWFALRVDGDSMDRVSPDDSIIVVNKADRQLVSGRFYVFSLRGETTYKRWRPDPPRLVPYSTNPANESIFVKSQKDFAVIGRVKRTVLDL